MKINIKSIKGAIFLLSIHADFVFADRYSDAVCDGDCGSGGNPLDFIVFLVLVGYWWVLAMNSYIARVWFTLVIGGLSLYAVINSGKFIALLFAWILIGATILTWIMGQNDSENSNPRSNSTIGEPKPKELVKVEEPKESVKPKQRPIRITETYRISKAFTQLDDPINLLDGDINTNNTKPSEGMPTHVNQALQVQKVKCPFCRGGIDIQTNTCIKCGTGFSTLPSQIFDA